MLQLGYLCMYSCLSMQMNQLQVKISIAPCEMLSHMHAGVSMFSIQVELVMHLARLHSRLKTVAPMRCNMTVHLARFQKLNWLVACLCCLSHLC